MTDYAAIARKYGGQAVDGGQTAQPDYASLARQYGGSASSAQPQAQTVTATDSFLRGVKDPIDAGAQMLVRAVPDPVRRIVDDFGNWLSGLGFPVSRSSGVEGVDSLIRNDEQSYQAGRQQDGVDWWRLGGNVAATAPIAMVAPATGGMASRMAVGAARGGAFGALQPVTEGDFATEKGKQVLTGAAVGGIAEPVAAGISRMVRPQTNPQVQQLMKEGITPTPGQILGGTAQRIEDKMTSFPIVGDAISSARRNAINQFNKAVYNRALNPIGKKAGDEVGFKGVQAVRRALGDAYDELLPKLSFKADAAFNQELAQVRQMVATLPPQQAKRFEQILKQQVTNKLTPQGLANGARIKEIESQLGKFARGYERNPDFDTRQLGDALFEVQATIRRTLERANPQFAQDLKAINTGYANFARIRNAASRVGATDGVFTPAQFNSAVRQMDTSVGKGATATGQAFMQDLSGAGKAVLGSTYPDSGTAGRTMLGAITAGAGYGVDPIIPMGLAAASTPYLPVIRNATAAALTKRPAFATPLAEGIRAVLPPLAAASAPALTK